MQTQHESSTGETVLKGGITAELTSKVYRHLQIVSENIQTFHTSNNFLLAQSFRYVFVFALWYLRTSLAWYGVFWRAAILVIAGINFVSYQLFTGKVVLGQVKPGTALDFRKNNIERFASTFWDYSLCRMNSWKSWCTVIELFSKTPQPKTPMPVFFGTDRSRVHLDNSKEIREHKTNQSMSWLDEKSAHFFDVDHQLAI